jgi:RNA-directed DNA polymerase
MNAMERSDSSKVVKKQANKAALAAAEPVERRDGAKENADLQTTVRTQSREAVSQAQGRIRVAVTRNRRKEADGASASHRHKYVARKLPWLEEVCSAGCR